MKNRLFLVLFLSLFYFSTAHALLDIEITQTVDAPIPLAIVPMGGEERAPTSLTEVIRADLKRSGEFGVLPVSRMAERPSRSQEVNPAYWHQVDIDAVLVGDITRVSEGRYRVNVELIDMAHNMFGTKSKVLFAEQYTVPESALRTLAHHISDLVYKTLLGNAGVFSTQIAYITVMQDERGKGLIYRLEVADADGYRSRPLLTSREPIMSPAWSPDGKKIAYVSFEHYRAQIYISDVATGQRERVSSTPGINGAPAWSPDGRELAIVLSHEKVPKIYRLNLATRQLTKVTDGLAIDTEPVFTPDGRSLLFTSSRGGQPQIYKIDLRSNAITRITFEGEYNARGRITSDGRYLVMLQRRSGQYYIAALDLKTGRNWRLTESALDESPTISPNGRLILYGTIEGGRRVLAGVSLDGRVRLRIPTREGDVQEPAWGY